MECESEPDRQTYRERDERQEAALVCTQNPVRDFSLPGFASEVSVKSL